MRDWIPSPDDVGAVIRARTKEKNGSEVGTFTDTTRPTRDGVLPLIDEVVERIVAACGQIPDSKQAFARRTAAIGVAAEVEMSYFQDQINNDRSPYDRLVVSFDTRLAELKLACVNDDGDNGTPEGLPITFNSDERVMLGFGIRW